VEILYFILYFLQSLDGFFQVLKNFFHNIACELFWGHDSLEPFAVKWFKSFIDKSNESTILSNRFYIAPQGIMIA